MAKPLTRSQMLEDTAFLRVLRQTGNARGAARAIDARYGTMQHRRKHHPAFAARWDAALAVAHARLNQAGGVHGPRIAAIPTMSGQGNADAQTGARAADGAGGRDETGGQDGVGAEDKAGARDRVNGGMPNGGRAAPREGHRTRGGESVVVRCQNGTYQVRAAQPGKLTQACEQAFLAALSATANVTLSAAAAGATPRAFYRRRKHNPAFAREMHLALTQGYERVEMALLASCDVDSGEHDSWRHNDPPEMPQMTVEQAIQLLWHHQKEVRLQAEPAHIKRRRGESREAHSYRLAAMYRAGQERDRQAYLVAEAARREGPRSPHEPPAPLLPSLDQVTGWSKAGK